MGFKSRERAAVAADAVIVSDRSFASSEPYDIIESNISVVNVMFEEHLRADEIAPDAMCSYWVDYYLAQVKNGGFSQFVYNSRWALAIISAVAEGLRAMGAKEHAALFARGREQVRALGERRLCAYFESEYFGKNRTRDRLNAINDEFFETDRREDLIEHNAAWLRGLPDLVVLSIDQMRAEIDRRAAALPDLDERIATARANEPRYTKLIRALCEAAGQELSHVTAGDPGHEYQGQNTLAWHFISDRGHHYMVETEDAAIMFDGDTDAEVTRIELP